MKIRLIKYVFPVLLAAAPYIAAAQGCADAGFCTADNIKPNERVDTSNQYKGQLKIGHSYGLAQFGVHVFSPYIEYKIALTPKLSFTNKLLAVYRTGELTSVLGLSDVISTLNYAVHSKLSLIAGVKFPLNKSDLKYNGVVLPMSYQTSLGTYDFILGTTWRFNRFALTAAYQQPFTQNNNSFLNEPANPAAYNKPYYSTNQYQRKADVLFRLSYPIQSKRSKTIITPSIMPIYHLANDTYTDSKNQEVIIQNSKGLTLNIGAFMYHQINERNAIELSLGAPIVSRKARPDGLSQFAFTVDYLIQLHKKKP
jgi:hypothetical protein